MNPEDVLKQYIFSLLGREYIYGGAGPCFDCSGFVMDIMKAYGYQFPHDMTAQQIFEFLKPTAEWDKKRFGSVVFYGQSTGTISHVAFCLNALQMAEAGGGNDKTITKEIAQSRGAFTRIRSIYHRKDIVAILYPRYAFSL